VTTESASWIIAWNILQEAVNGREVELHSRPTDNVKWNRASIYVRGDARDAYRSCCASGCGETISAALIAAINDFKEYQAGYTLSMGKLMAMDHAEKRNRRRAKA
jgi:hypothetical protein